MAKREDISSIDIQKVLLDMREYRMGLIQTPDLCSFDGLASAFLRTAEDGWTFSLALFFSFVKTIM
jgi:hypothetical protein